MFEPETLKQDTSDMCHFEAVGYFWITQQEILQFISKSLGDCTEFVEKQNTIGETALHMACRIVKGNLHFKNEDTMIIKTLMENKSNPTIQTSTTKEAPMHYVCATGNKDILEELIKYMHSGQVQLAINQQSATGRN